MTRSVVVIDCGEEGTGYVVFKVIALQELPLESWAQIKISAVLVPTDFLQSLSFLLYQMSPLDVFSATQSGCYSL